MKPILLAICILAISSCFAQEEPIKELDSLYKEDQFYAGVSYNLLDKRPSGVKQSGFSLGFHLGFIKDMPINERRNLAIGIGLGYSANSHNQNLLVSKSVSGDFSYSVIEGNNTYKRNKFSTHLIELPIEFRWRTSTPQDYNFWRIYAGFKLGYAFVNTIKYRGDMGDFKYSDRGDFNDLQYGPTLSVGYNTWNLHIYYALNPIFNGDAQLNNKQIDMKAIKIGLMFYIL
ncbi:porin family protein [Flavobacteriaceae bacterium SZ-1-7]|uniref:porin family protein n=1 Tax=Tamlana sedimenti TaxID=3134126 RepID=UPI00312481BD